MVRWNPSLLMRTIIIGIGTAILCAAIATVASFFVDVDSSTLLSVLGLSFVISTVAASRVFVEVGRSALRIGSVHRLIPKTYCIPYSQIRSVSVLDSCRAHTPHILKIEDADRARNFPMGWLSLSDVHRIAESVRDRLTRKGS
jgi:hypothetical protein